MDPAAMKANADLVEQVRDYKERLARADEAAKTKEVKARARATDAPEAFVPGVDAWARMSQTGVLRVKTPCSNWDGHGHFEVRRPNRGSVTMGGRRIDAAARADAAGVSREELTAVVEAYARAHTRAWTSVRATCEANDAYKELMDESEDELDDERRLLACRRVVLAPGTESTRSAVRRVAELRATSASASRATTDEERVLFAMTESMSTLWDELVGGLGREKALAAIDYGLLCTHETVFLGREKDGV